MILEIDENCAAGARTFVAECLAEFGVPDEPSFDILLALNEAVGNACRHAYAGASGGTITIRCEVDGEQLMLSVSDRGKGFTFDPDMFEMPDPLSSRGRGFFMMQELMDEVEINTDEVGTSVIMRSTVARIHAGNNH